MSYCKYVCGVRVKSLALFQLGIQFPRWVHFKNAQKTQNGKNLQLGLINIYSAFDHERRGGGIRSHWLNIIQLLSKSYVYGMGEGSHFRVSLKVSPPKILKTCSFGQSTLQYDTYYM